MATPSRIMAAKVRRPAPVGLERPRLSAPLRSVEQARSSQAPPAPAPGIVVVIAPPGSGKTTLLALASGGVSASAWCTAGPEDRSGHVFLDHLTGALDAAAGRDLGRPRSVMELVEAWEGPASGGAASTLLVVDDAHELTGGPAEEALAALLRWRPVGLRIAVGTRRPLSLNTSRLLVSGDLAELDAEDLRFRTWEVEELFRSIYHEPLSPEAAAALARRTGGWAAGLMLFHLATAGKPQPLRERAVVELGGRSRLLRSYLTRTVLDELDAGTRRFLLVTSTLGTLTGPLCDALLGRSGSAMLLEDLASRQFFTSAAEDGRSYRYHQVMQTLLEGLLVDEYGGQAAREVYALSARLLEDCGLLSDAARAYVLAEDQASVARIVQRAEPGVAPDAWGPQTRPSEDPWLLLARARRLWRRGAVEPAVETYRRAEELIDDAELRARCAAERSAAALWLPDGASRLLPLGRRGGVDQTLRRALARIGDPVPGEGAVGRALRTLLAGDLGTARLALGQAPRRTPVEGLLADLAGVVVDALGPGDDAEPAPDRIAVALGRLEQVVLAADLVDQPWLARVARGLQGSALLLREPEEWRLCSCVSLVEDCGRDGDAWGALLLAGSLAASLTVRDHPQADAWLARAAVMASPLHAPVVAAWMLVLRAVAAEGRGEVEAPEHLQRARAAARGCGLVDAERVVRAVLARHEANLSSTAESAAEALPGAVRLRCLGSFAVEVAGRPVDLPRLRPLPRALLMLLAMHGGQEVHREQIMAWLWPEASVEVAAHRLHAAASAARRRLAEARVPGAELQRRGASYRLVAHEASFDVADLDAAVREVGRSMTAGDPERALAQARVACELYRGDLLPEAGPEEWVVEERQRLRVAAASAAYTAAELALRLESPPEALAAAYRAVDLDPLRDSAWQLLSLVQARMGDQSAAAATRRAHGVATRALADRARSVTPAGSPPGAGRAPA